MACNTDLSMICCELSNILVLLLSLRDCAQRTKLECHVSERQISDALVSQCLNSAFDCFLALIRASKSRASSSMLLVEGPKSLVSYPNVITRAKGSRSGSRSCSQKHFDLSLATNVQVLYGSPLSP